MIHLDSTNRNINTFESSTNFEVPINQTDNGDRTNMMVQNDVLNYFQWVGNSEHNNPISKLKNDTFLTKIIPISFNQCIVIPVNEYISKQIYQKDYFIGIKIYFDYNNKIGTIIAYDYKTYTVTIDLNVFQYYFENILYDDYKDKNLSEFYRDAYFVNTSYHQGNNIILSTNVHSGYIVENVTQKWKRTIKKRNEKYFIENLASLSYNLLDTYIVYASDSKYSRLYSLSCENNNNDNVLKVLDNSISFLMNHEKNYVVLMIDKLEKERKYYKIDKVDFELNEITLMSKIPFSIVNQIIVLLPIQNIFSSLSIDQNEYKKKISLRLLQLSIPNKKLELNNSTLQLKNIPFLILKINSDTTINKLSSNIPELKSSFICFSSNRNKKDATFIDFYSSDILELTEMFRHEFKFAIMLPNNKEILSFHESDMIQITSNNQNLLLYDFKQTLSMLFEII